MLEDKTSNYIEVYDKEGKQLVSHKSIIDENGYPINFSMSDDGERMGSFVPYREKMALFGK